MTDNPKIRVVIVLDETVEGDMLATWTSIALLDDEGDFIPPDSRCGTVTELADNSMDRDELLGTMLQLLRDALP